MTSRLARYDAKCVQRRCFQCGSVPLHSDIKGTELLLANILIPLKRQLIALQLCCWQFLYNADFCIGYAEYPPYFYFRSSWPTDLESASRDVYLTMKVSTKFEVDTSIRCLVIALLLLIRYVTLTFDLLTLVSGHTWRVTWSIPPPSLKILRLSVLEL